MSAGPRFPAIAEHLREATRLAHRALDHHPLLAPLVRAPLGLADYGRALAALRAPQSAIEALLHEFAPAGDFPSRMADLDRDLGLLGRAAFPLQMPLPRFDSVAERLGAMYVVEGSNLGGAVIARMLEQSLPTGTPKCFFAHAGGPERWARFWQFAGGQCRDEQFATIAEAACRAFAFYKAHLDACLAESDGR